MSRIAIIGSGISGLTSAYLLSQKHDITLFEANDTLGGHTATVDVHVDGQDHAIDTGFIVFNDRTYPNFLRLLERTGVRKQATEMSFSVQHALSGIEYNGNNLSSLFAQRRNLLSPRFYGFIREILRFNRLSKEALKSTAAQNTLGDFLQQHGFSDFFASHYILPMVAAIWSSSLEDARAFPLAFFLRFFNHHGLLNVVDRPQWYVIEGGSRSYIPALTQPLQDIRLGQAVSAVERIDSRVRLTVNGQQEIFDEVIIACHSDQALALLKDASSDEQAILGNLAYRNNDVVLHTDERLLPDNRRAWASWNFWQGEAEDTPPAVTYNMNILQGLDTPTTFCVTLNRSSVIDPTKILRRFTYAHPVYNQQTIDAQARRLDICGYRHTHFCGAYWYNGFHEDGVSSALDVCTRFGVTL